MAKWTIVFHNEPCFVPTRLDISHETTHKTNKKGVIDLDIPKRQA